MELAGAVRGLTCTDCGATAPTDTFGRCPDCEGLLRVALDHDAVDAADVRERAGGGRDRFAALLPPSPLEEGGTPLVDCPSLADDLGVDSLAVKDEGRNPTGSVRDREFAVAVAAADAADRAQIALPTTGNGGQAAAAHAGRVGLDSEAFVPTRCPFVNKAMVNVHGGSMTVVEGRYADALAAYEDAAAAADWTPLGPASPYRRAGARTLYYELAAALDWTAPDALVVPTGHGVTLAGVHAAVEDLATLGLVTDPPRLYAVQPDGCAPVADAWAADERVSPTATPDTIVGPLEVGDPAAGDLVLDAVAATDGGAVAVSDDALLEAGVDAATDTGVEVGATGGVAVAGARALAETGAFEGTESVVLVNPVAGSKESDLLRSYLMSQGM